MNIGSSYTQQNPWCWDALHLLLDHLVTCLGQMVMGCHGECKPKVADDG